VTGWAAWVGAGAERASEVSGGGRPKVEVEACHEWTDTELLRERMEGSLKLA